jgi:hypothetical protein
MLPLAAMNSRAVVGCGCFDHIEAVYQCKGDDSSCSQTAHLSSTCCQKHQAEQSQHNCDNVPDGTCVGGHHCIGAIQREVIPVTLVSSYVAANEVSKFAVASSAIDLLPAYSPTATIYLTEHSAPPPYDRVVTLRRLLI